MPSAALVSVREDLDPRPRECVACYVSRILARDGCSGGHDLLLWWGSIRAPRATTLVPRFSAAGAGCDCQVLTHVLAPVDDLGSSSASPWDRPPCYGTVTGSARPCGRWRLRPRW